MNGLVIVLIAIVVLGAGYLLYGRWLANKWGLDPKAKTPAYTHEDGQDYVPSSKLTVFAHQFSSIAGAEPVTGPILASVFGWVPVLLWLLIGGLFFGAVQDFGALYASVKNEGKSMGMIIEKYIGRTGWTLYIPMFVMLAVTFTALIQKTIALVSNIAGGQATFLVDGLQFIVAILLMVLGVLVAFSCLKKLFTAKKQEA